MKRKLALKRNALLLAMAALMAAFLACSLPTSEPAGVTATVTPALQVGTMTASTAVPEPLKELTEVAQDPCDHEYFPTDEGATWEYAGTHSREGSYHRTDTISESRDDGFSMTWQFRTLTLTMEWTCTEAALIALDPSQQFVTAVGTGTSGKRVMRTLGQGGITLPKQLNPGISWQQWVQWETTGGDETLHGEYTFDSTAMGLEVVTVPFGTFSAMRVDTGIEMSVEGQEVLTCQISTWIVKAVGRIKQEADCMTSTGSEVTDVIELESYDSP